MARPLKTTCDYFPHYTEPGKTMFIIERRFGNDGYAVLFKTLEMIGKQDHHFLELSNPGIREYFIARCGCENALEIIQLLAEIGTLDLMLWQDYKVIYSEAFVNNLKSLYARRGVYVCSKHDIQSYCMQKYNPTGNSASINDILNYIKLNKIKLNEIRGDYTEPVIAPGNNNLILEDEQAPEEVDEMNYKKIVSEYNEKFAETFGKVEVLSDTRKRKLKILNKEIGFDNIIPLFERSKASDFLRGKNNRGWTATFDWIINLTNTAKILSGNYDNRGGGQMAGAQDYIN